MHNQAKEMTYDCNICFVDVDGVLTSCDAEGASYVKIVREYPTMGPDQYTYTERCIKLLEDFCHENNCKIVISSNWRRFALDDSADGSWSHGKIFFKNPLLKIYERLGDLVVGTLPKDRHINKSQALKLWFELGNKINGKFVIFDDDVSEGFSLTQYCTNFVLTDFEVGLSQQDIEKAKEIIK